MRWFGGDSRFGSWLALAALALQLVLSFGHVHLDGIGRASTLGAIAGPAAAATPGSHSLPAQHPSDSGDEYCPICATLYLAANSFLPQAPQLPVPFVCRTIEHVDHAAVAFVAPRRRAPFQSRAPPLA